MIPAFLLPVIGLVKRVPKWAWGAVFAILLFGSGYWRGCTDKDNAWLDSIARGKYIKGPERAEVHGTAEVKKKPIEPTTVKPTKPKPIIVPETATPKEAQRLLDSLQAVIYTKDSTIFELSRPVEITIQDTTQSGIGLLTVYYDPLGGGPAQYTWKPQRERVLIVLAPRSWLIDAGEIAGGIAFGWFAHKELSR